MKKKIAIEIGASCLTLIAQFLGTTTPTGSIIYMLAGAAWASWVIIYRQWGLAPINVAGDAIGFWNLWAAFR